VKLLLDTHALLWWLSDDASLGAPARELVADPANDIVVSVVSLWEIQVKCRIGKLAADMPELLREIAGQGLGLLPIDPRTCCDLAACRRITGIRSISWSSPRRWSRGRPSCRTIATRHSMTFRW
jgi:PIN domain nuclease of toxin-antitoxin system